MSGRWGPAGQTGARGHQRPPPEPGDPGQAPPSPGDTSVQRHRAGEPTPQPGHGHSPPLQLDGHARPTPADSATWRETPRPQAPRRHPHRAPDLDLHTARGHVHPGAGTQPGRPAWAHVAPAHPASPAAWPSPRRDGLATPTRSPHSMDTPVQPDTQTQTHPRSLADNGPRHPPAPWASPARLLLRSPGTGAQRGPGPGAPQRSRPGPSAPRRDRRIPGPRPPASSWAHRPVSQGTPAWGQGATAVSPRRHLHAALSLLGPGSSVPCSPGRGGGRCRVCVPPCSPHAPRPHRTPASPGSGARPRPRWAFNRQTGYRLTP